MYDFIEDMYEMRGKRERGGKRGKRQDKKHEAVMTAPNKITLLPCGSLAGGKCGFALRAMSFRGFRSLPSCGTEH